MAEEKKKEEKKEEKKTVKKETKKSAGNSLSKNDIIKAIEQMTVLELADLVKKLEDKFGVTPISGIANSAASGAGEAKEEEKEEQTVFNVVLSSFGENKISVIKAVRELVPTLGLADAKNLVESAPKEVLTQVDKKAANEAKEKLEKAGAKVELK